MPKLLHFIKIAIALYKKYRLGVLFFYSLLSLLIGYFIIGPFMISDAYQWYADFASKNPILGELINFSDMFIDKFLASTIPFFILWSCVLAVYLFNEKSITTINQISSHISFVVGGTAFLTIVFGFCLVGTSLFALKNIGHSTELVLFAIGSWLIVIMGFFFRNIMKPSIVSESYFNKAAPALLISCVTIGLGLYIYGIFNDPLKFMNTINKHHEISLK